MGEERVPSLLTSSLRSNPVTTSSLRFLGVHDQSCSYPNPSESDDLLELDEDDIWASAPASASETGESPPLVPKSPLASSPAHPKTVSVSLSPPTPNGALQRNRYGKFDRVKSGLSAALVDEPKSLLQRRNPGLDPSVSAAKAVPLLRSGSGLDSSMMRSGSGRLFHMSAPVDVPVWPEKERKGFGERIDELGNGEMEEENAEEEEEEEKMVPPHVMVARSHAATFSVVEGVGRTLKGRDLRRVRNAVLQKTGFLD